MRIHCDIRVQMLTAVLLAYLPMFIYAQANEAGEDPVERAIAKRKTESATTETLSEVDAIIKANPNHPKILQLRFWRIRAMKGISRKEDNIREAISEYKNLLKEVGPDTELGYDCLKDIGSLLFNYLQASEEAYCHYKSMENHPLLSGDDLQSQYRKIQLYRFIAWSAQGARRTDEAEKYALLVMAYPYLGMKDRDMYRKFYQLYREAGNTLLTIYCNDKDKLKSIEIYPSQQWLYKRRQELLNGTFISPPTGVSGAPTTTTTERIIPVIPAIRGK